MVEHKHKNKNTKLFKRAIIVAVVCLCFLLIFNCMHTVVQRFKFYHNLDITSKQITKLVHNIRTIYSMNNFAELDIQAELIRSGVVPQKFLAGRNIKNVYNGNVMMSQALAYEYGERLIPTFKFSYQGLSQETCVALATMNWGNEDNGLVALAVGTVYDDKDTAFNDIEYFYTQVEPKLVVDANGRNRVVEEKPERLSTVAKVNDTLIPVPFSEELARKGCACGKSKNCSFALRYAVYGLK